jgi:sugar-specific transcriptional regulator TrmB
MLPKLEKMGLITRTVAKPFMIEAIPVEKALASLTSAIKREKAEEISRLDADLEELMNLVGKQQEMRKTVEEKRRCILFESDSEIENMADLAFEKVRIEFDWVTNLELITRLTPSFSERFRTLAGRGVKIRIIVETVENEDLVTKTLEEIRPVSGDFVAKLFCKSESLPYQIFDHKELWISGKQLTERGFPCVLWTNGRNTTQFYEESFKKAWNNPRAISIYPKKPQKKLAKAW